MGFWKLRGPRGVRKRMRGSRGVGQAWEDLAAVHLKRAGYRILERNFRCRPAEIDFVAMDGPVLCFIEVKGRSGTRFGRPEEAVDAEKQGRIVRAVEIYLHRRSPDAASIRFDVVAILGARGREAVEIFRGAFEASTEPPRQR
jgi:putative endonuclease